MKQESERRDKDVIEELRKLEYVKENRNYMNTFKFCSVGEDFFFQNIIMNSPLKVNVCNDTLIYDEWGKRGNPAFLDETDIENLKKTKALFARKVGKSGKNVWNEIRRYHNF